MILNQARIHKYTHTNHQLSALNIKYYNFDSSFNITEFYSKKLHVDAEVIHSMIQGQYLALKCRPQKRSTPTGSPSTGPTIESRALTDKHPQYHRKREKNYMYIVRSTR
jgi:hypothetical protein